MEHSDSNLIKDRAQLEISDSHDRWVFRSILQFVCINPAEHLRSIFLLNQPLLGSKSKLDVYDGQSFDCYDLALRLILCSMKNYIFFPCIKL